MFPSGLMLTWNELYGVSECDNVNIIHLFYVYTTVVVIATILCNTFSIAIVEPS